MRCMKESHTPAPEDCPRWVQGSTLEPTKKYTPYYCQNDTSIGLLCKTHGTPMTSHFCLSFFKWSLWEDPIAYVKGIKDLLNTKKFHTLDW